MAGDADPAMTAGARQGRQSSSRALVARTRRHCCAKMCAKWAVAQPRELCYNRGSPTKRKRALLGKKLSTKIMQKRARRASFAHDACCIGCTPPSTAQQPPNAEPYARRPTPFTPSHGAPATIPARRGRTSAVGQLTLGRWLSVRLPLLTGVLQWRHSAVFPRRRS